MRRTLLITSILSALLCLQGCNALSSFFLDDEVVARVGHKRLYKSEVDALIPPGTPVQDSISIASSYINTWASDLVYLKVAQEKLSKSEKNVKLEVEQYRNALLKYRYEQRYIEEHLDTTVTDEQILEYYNSHQQSLVLTYPIAKVRFIRLAPASVPVDKVCSLLASDDPADQMELDSVIYSFSEKYSEFGDKWIEIPVLAREFNTDYGTLLSMMSGSFIRMDEADGRVSLAYISAYMRSGSVPPVEFCRGRICDVVISMRKQALLADLERDLLDQARGNGLFETFEKNEE